MTAAALYTRIARRTFSRMMAIWTDYSRRAFEADSKQFACANERTLRRILRRHRNTEFGRAHGFSAALAAGSPAEAFRRRVPLSQYSDYEQALHRMAMGERNVLVSDPVIFFAPSSGTTGKSKLIPVTERSMRNTVRTLVLTRSVFGQLRPGGASAARGISLVRMSDNLSTTAAGIPTGDASAAGMRRAAAIIPYLYTTPLAAMQIEDKPSALFIHLLFGLPERDLNHVSATFAHNVVYLFRTLEQRWPELLDSIATGRLPDDLVLKPDERRNIERLLEPNPDLARALQPELEKGFENIARRLWPNFSFVAAATTGSFAAYMETLRGYVGSVPVCNLLYGATEACIGINVDLDTPEQYALLPRSCAFEFIPLENTDDAEPRTVGVEELEQGRQYEVVITSDAGFYRYRMDDVVRVAGFRNGSPRVEFQFRRGTILNVAAEKTTEKQVADVIRSLESRWLRGRGRVLDYTVAAETGVSPPHYRFFIELDTDSGLWDSAWNQEAAQFLDQELAAANVDFKLMRNARVIGQPVVNFLQLGCFGRLLAEMPNSNAAKIPRVVAKPEHVEFLVGQSIVGELILKSGSIGQ
ncbi:MAG: GH3 auxin-responsive promoter family protein [Gammaproteobacteria bacterium]|nr:GH3 auxin-responsive promoter family protein [Gammaproteobacteria bacterium]